MKKQTRTTCSAIVLAAGQGRRMGAKMPKQYLDICGKPMFMYSIETFASSSVEEIVLVVAPGEVEFCKEKLQEVFLGEKIIKIVEGGQQRYDSVYAGLKEVTGDYVLIHDCARIFLQVEQVEFCRKKVEECDACALGMPVKDTIKIVDEKGIVKATPKRDELWLVQTPQCFRTSLIQAAYEKLYQGTMESITDDAMVLETMTEHPMQLVIGSYENIKLTTPEDIVIAETMLSLRKGKFNSEA